MSFKRNDLVTQYEMDEAIAGGGGGGGTLYVEMDDQGALSSTWKEIRDALAAHKLVVVYVEFLGDSVQNNLFVSIAASEEGTYYVSVVGANEDQTMVLMYTTESENGYPVVYQP